MGAGKYNKRVAFYQLVTGSPAVNSMGEPNTSWELVATVWAAVKPLTGREFFAQQQIQNEVTGRIEIRYRTDILVGMKAVYGGRDFMIQTIIDNQEEHRELQLMVSEGVINA